MATPAHTSRRMSPEAYLAWEEEQLDRHEYYRGEVFAMAGGTFRHSQLASNLMRALGNTLAGKGCHVLTGDMRVHVPANGLYTYPDVSVVCGPPEFETERETTLLNPVLLVEVLSDSTENYDRGAKFRLYRGIPSLREYLLVSQKARHLDLFRRGEEGWFLLDPDDEGRLQLASVDAALTVDAVYEGVEVPDREPPPEPDPPPGGAERF